jgi:subtilisin family serine protease
MNLTFQSNGSRATIDFKSIGQIETHRSKAGRVVHSRAGVGERLLGRAIGESVPRRAAGNRSHVSNLAAIVTSAEGSLTSAVRAIKSSLGQQHDAWNDIHESDTRYVLDKDGSTLVVATDSISVEGVKKADLKYLRDQFGFQEIREGRHGKLLLRCPDTNKDALQLAQAAINSLYERMGQKGSAHPHFLRAFFRPRPSAAGGKPLWNHHNTGNPGIAGADVAAHAAWLYSQGSRDIRVAVLDEGLDSDHPALRSNVVGEHDVVDRNSHARPDGDDAHGTACAGIIASTDAKYPGLAPKCALLGVRIAKGDGNNGWIIDDFSTADAIDWSWEEGKADVLSNSWGGGPAVDVVINAIRRANKKGRGGKGALVVFAAGNSNGKIHFPGNLQDVLTVGASSPWDERKNPNSLDGENWWGSCFGPELDLLAPGVKIATTDISGASGYSADDFTESFNGTSSATPHVAAAAALVLSVKPSLKLQQVRDVLTSSCDPLTLDGKWHREFGWGRLNIYRALRLAMR